MELKCLTLQKELVWVYENFKDVNSLPEEVEIYGSPSTLVTHVIEFEGSLEDAEKWYQAASDSCEEKTHRVKEHQKILLQETKDRAEAQKALQEEVASLKRELCDSLQRTIQDVLGFCEQIVEQARRLCPNAIVFVVALVPFKSSPAVT